MSQSVTYGCQNAVYLLQIEIKGGYATERSCSVTSGGSKTVLLLQIEMFCIHRWGRAASTPVLPHIPLLSPLADMSAATLLD